MKKKSGRREKVLKFVKKKRKKSVEGDEEPRVMKKKLSL